MAFFNSGCRNQNEAKAGTAMNGRTLISHIKQFYAMTSGRTALDMNMVTGIARCGLMMWLEQVIAAT